MSQANRIALQRFLNSKGARLIEDGAIGAKTRAEIWARFAAPRPVPISPGELAVVAASIPVDIVRLLVVAEVESNGGGFLADGRPKILWERHWFWRRLKVKLGASLPGQWLAHPDPGGYTLDADHDGLNDSWEKLIEACAHNPIAAFESCSWGKFQIMGGHWKALGYPSVFDFAFSMVGGEVGHYRALAAFIRTNRMAGAMQRLSIDARQNEEFARRYNGRGFRKNEYHIKLARALRLWGG